MNSGSGARRRPSDGAVAQKVEEYCFRYLLIGGSLLLIGLILMLTAVLFWLGAPLAAIGGAVISGNIVWFLRVRKRQGLPVSCPSCEKQYTVLPGTRGFICTECQHAVSVPYAHQ